MIAKRVLPMYAGVFDLGQMDDPCPGIRHEAGMLLGAIDAVGITKVDRLQPMCAVVVKSIVAARPTRLVRFLVSHSPVTPCNHRPASAGKEHVLVVVGSLRRCESEKIPRHLPACDGNH